MLNQKIDISSQVKILQQAGLALDAAMETAAKLNGQPTWAALVAITPQLRIKAKPATKPTQVQMFYKADRHVASINEHFLFLVNTGLTREDLVRCIERRPSLWARFATWVPKLPSRNSVVA